MTTIEAKKVIVMEQNKGYYSDPSLVINFLNKHSDLKLTPNNEKHFSTAQSLINSYINLN
jgi:hypothetical protein